METELSVCCHFRVSHFCISSINVPQREMLSNTLVAYKWLIFIEIHLWGGKKREEDLAIGDSKELA